MQRRRLFAIGLTLSILGSVPWTAAADPEPSYQGKSLQVWISALKHKDARVRFEAAVALGKLGAPQAALAPLIAAVKDEDSQVRSAALGALSQSDVANPSIVAAVLGALKDRQVLVRVDAETALGKLPLSTLQAGMRPLMIALKDTNPTVRRVAQETVKRFGPETTDLVKDLVAASQSKTPAVRRIADLAWDGMDPPSKEMRADLSTAAKAQDPELRRAAVLVVDMFSPLIPEALSILRDALTDQVPTVRRLAARALGRMGPAAREAAPTLIIAYQDPDEEVRKAVTVALPHVLSGVKDVAILITALPIQDRPVWQAATRTLLAIIQDTKDLQTLRATLTAPETSVRQATAAALGRIGPEAVPSLIEMLQDENVAVRAAAARALGDIIRGTKDLPTLRATVKAPDASVRRATTAALGAIGAEAVPSLIELLKDVEPTIRKMAAESLRGIGPQAKDAVPALKARLIDTDGMAQVAAALALWKISATVTDAVPVLTAALKHPEEPVRVYAAEGLGDIGPAAKEAVPALRAMSQDQNANQSTTRRAATAALRKIGVEPDPPGAPTAKKHLPLGEPDQSKTARPDFGFPRLEVLVGNLILLMVIETLLLLVFRRTAARIGLVLLSVFNLLTGTVSGIWLIGESRDVFRDVRFVVPAALLTSSICLLIRRPWGWLLTATVQLLVAGLCVFAALFGLLILWWSGSTNEGMLAETGILANLGVPLSLMVFGIAMGLAAAFLTGFFYLMLSRVRAAFHVGTTSSSPKEFAPDAPRPSPLEIKSWTEPSTLPRTPLSTTTNEQLLPSYDRPPAGLLVLTAFNLLTGIGCGACLIGLSLDVGASVLGVVAVGIVAGAMVAPGICLLIRRPWGWLLAAACQLFVGGIAIIPAFVGLSLAEDFWREGDSWVAMFGIPLSLFLVGCAMVPAAVSFTGFCYLMRPHVIAAFHVGTQTWKRFRWAAALLLLICAYAGTGALVWGELAHQTTLAQMEQLRLQPPLMHCSWQAKKIDRSQGEFLAGLFANIYDSSSVWTFKDDGELLIGKISAKNRYESGLFDLTHYRWTLSDDTLTLVRQHDDDQENHVFKVEECTANTLRLREETIGPDPFGGLFDKERKGKERKYQYHFQLERCPRVWFHDPFFLHNLPLAVPMRLAVLLFAALVTWLLTYRACRSRLRALAVNSGVMTLVGIPLILITVIGFLSHPRMSVIPSAESETNAIIAGLVTATGCALGGLLLGCLPGACRADESTS